MTNVCCSGPACSSKYNARAVTTAAWTLIITQTTGCVEGWGQARFQSAAQGVPPLAPSAAR